MWQHGSGSVIYRVCGGTAGMHRSTRSHTLVEVEVEVSRSRNIG